MANRQKIASANLGGALLKNPIETVPQVVRNMDGLYDDSNDYWSLALVELGRKSAKVVQNMMDKKEGETEPDNNSLKVQQNTEDMRQAMQADQVMNEQRLALANTTSRDEFIETAKNAEAAIKNTVSLDAGLNEFFNRHSEKLMAAHEADTKRLYEIKSAEFGKNSFDEMLSLNQNMLAQSTAAKGEKLLAQGIGEISSTPFLQDEQKQAYRQEYLQGGILNLALHDAEGALKSAEKYLPDDEGIKLKISETKRLREEAVKKAEEREQRQTDMGELSDAFAQWQAFEGGQLDAASYYVLGLKNKEATRVAYDTDFGVRAPLSKAYQMMRRLNKREELSAAEIKEAGESLISAYKAGNIGLDVAGGFQNRMVMAGLADQDVTRVLDSGVDELIDEAVCGDAVGRGLEAEAFMEEKAKFAFDVYDAFYERKTALIDDFEAAGGTLTEGVLRRLGRRAALEISDEMGLKKNEGGVSYAALERKMGRYYSGVNTAAVWREFCKKAPYAEDKEELFSKVCAAQERLEADLPRFYSLDEVQRAGLKEGEQFYYQGRLAVIG